tara:strand:+ start:6449 stop:7228 length:780 start_codon:yes stop_codon:yes gene_type:complete
MLETVNHAIEMRKAGGRPQSGSFSGPIERLLIANAKTARPGQFLLMEGDVDHPVFCLLRGWLSLSKSLPDGETQIMDFAIQGDIIEPSGTARSGAPINIEALTDVSFAMISVPAWEDAKRQWRDLDRISGSIRMAAQARTANRMLRLGRGKATMRVAHALLELNFRLQAIGQSKDGKFHIPMNQRILGEFTGLSSVHVCRTLSRLATAGLVRVREQMDIEILDSGQLAQMAGVDLPTLQCECSPETDHLRPRYPYPAYA